MRAQTVRLTSQAREAVPSAAWVPVRLHLHCALGSLVANQCDLAALVRWLPVHLSFSLLLVLTVTSLSSGRRLWPLGLASFGLATFLVLRGAEPVLTLLLFLGALAMHAALLGPWRTRVHPTFRRVAFSVGHGVLPFLAGYVATDHRPGGSALLLALGFLGMCAGAFPVLHRRPSERPNRRVSWLSVILLLVGVASLGAWLWIYGAGLTGIALATPGLFWLLWLVAGWVIQGRHLWIEWNPRHQAITAWFSLQLAVALASYA